MANVYNVSIEQKGNFGNSRTISILTDTLQNAMAIGKSKCASNEEVTAVFLSQSDVVIDHQAVGAQQI